MKSREKISYEIDPQNRFVYLKTGKQSKVPRYRKVLDGNFSLDLGIDLKLSKAILKDQGEAFIQAFASRKEVELISGAGLRW